MKIHHRYLIREASGGVLLVLAGFLALFGFFDMVAEVKNVGQGDYHLLQAAAYVALRLPGRTYELMPIAVLIGTLYAVSTLARHSEIAVLRSSGLSTKRLLVTLLAAASIFALVTFLIGELVVPPSERLAQQVKLTAKGKVVGQDLQSGLWVKDDRRFINVKQVLPDTSLRGVRIYEFDREGRLATLTEAKEGLFVPPAQWRLSSVMKTHISDDGATTESLTDVEWKSALNPDILAVLMVSPEQMSLMHLRSYIRHLSDNSQKTERYDIALWKKIVYPLASLVMVALALPFGYTHNRVSGVSLKIFSGVMIGVLFHLLNGLFSNLGAINSWSPVLSAIAPSALFVLAASVMLWWVERR